MGWGEGGGPAPKSLGMPGKTKSSLLMLELGCFLSLHKELRGYPLHSGVFNTFLFPLVGIIAQRNKENLSGPLVEAWPPSDRPVR